MNLNLPPSGLNLDGLNLGNAEQNPAPTAQPSNNQSVLLGIAPIEMKKEEKQATSKNEAMPEDMRRAPYQLALEKVISFSHSLQFKRLLIIEQKNQSYLNFSFSIGNIKDRFINESFWQDVFPLHRDTNTHIFKKKINNFFDLIYNKFSSIFDSDSLTDFLPNGRFRTYLLQQHSDQNLQCLLNELSYFYDFLSNKKEQNEIIQNVFSIFPPSDSSDYECVPGMRIRLSAALTFAKKQFGDTSGQNTISESIQDEVMNIYNSHHQEVIFQYKLNQSVRAGSEIHLMSFLDYLLGIDRDLVIKKDPFVFTPQTEIKAEDAFNIFQNFSKKLESSDEKLKSIILNSTEDLFSLFKSTNFNETNLSDIKNHPMIKLMAEFDTEFDISNGKYLIEDEHDYTQYTWDLEKIKDDFIKILGEKILEEKKELDPSFNYMAVFEHDQTEKIVKNLHSDHANQVVQSLTLLFIAGGKFINSSPILFLKWIHHLNNEVLPNHQPLTNLEKQLYFIEKKWEGNHLYKQVIKSRVASITHSFNNYTSSTQYRDFEFPKYISFLRSNTLKSEVKILQELIRGNAPLYEITSIINKKIIEHYIGFLINPNYIAKHTQAIEIIKLYLDNFHVENLQQILVESYHNQRTRLIEQVFELPIPQGVFFNKIDFFKNGNFKCLFELFIENDEVDLVKKILSRGHHKNSYFFSISSGTSLIDLLINKNLTHLFKLLIENKIIDSNSLLKVDIYGRNFLHHIAENRECNFLPILIEYLSPIQQLFSQDKEKNNPLHVATMNNNTRFIQNIFENSNQFFSGIHANNQFNHNLLHTAIIYHAIEVFEFLSQSTFMTRLNRPDINLNTPLHLAVIAQEPNIVRTLLSNGGSFSNLFKLNNSHLNVFHLVAQMNQPEMLDVFISEKYGHGFFNYSNDPFHTPAHTAATFSNLSFIEHLMSLGIPKEQLIKNHFMTDRGVCYSMSPLDIAYQSRHYSIAQAILNYKPEIAPIGYPPIITA